MLGLRITPPGPFWLEDIAFLAVDGARRLPARMAGAARWLTRKVAGTRLADLADLIPNATKRTAPLVEPAPAIHDVQPEAQRLDAPLEWTLATEPLTSANIGTASAVALHRAAGDQLDALSYALDRIRDEVRPLMTYARLPDDKVRHLPMAAELETSIEALLELSRRNAATRPKNRALSAA